MSYIPDRGHIVWLTFDPQTGKEIQKRRPALVISPQGYNKKTGLALFMPITSQIKGYPFESVLNLVEIKGAILCDQTRSLDWKAREATYITTLQNGQMTEVIEKFIILLR